MQEAILVGVFTLLGAALGAASSHLMEWRRWKREDQARWYEKRYEAAKGLIVAADAISLLVYDARHHGLETEPDVIEEWTSEVRRYLRQELTVKIADLDLLASDPIRVAAHDLYDGYADLVSEALEAESGTPPDDAINVAWTRKSAFIELARDDIGFKREAQRS